MRLAIWFSLCATVLMVASTTSHAAENTIRFYIGTATTADKGGIFLSSFDTQSGEMAPPQLVAATERSTFIAFHPTLPVLYSVAELQGQAAVLAWQIDPASGKLTALGQQPAGGDGACFVIASHNGRYVAAANYGSGSISLYPLEKDGRLAAASANIQHRGDGPLANRQAGPHAHSVRFDADDKRLLAADLGTDDIFIYDIGARGELTPANPASLVMPAGSGPRHFVFSPDNRFVLGLGEMSGTISSFSFDPVKSDPLSTVSTMAADTPKGADPASAEILFHPKLPVVYCSNRGPHEIAVFDFDSASGSLTRRSASPSGGRVPRNFRFSPDGRFLLVANQGSNTVDVLRVDPRTGDLSPAGQSIQVPSPMCIKFVGDLSP